MGHLNLIFRCKNIGIFTTKKSTWGTDVVMGFVSVGLATQLLPNSGFLWETSRKPTCYYKSLQYLPPNPLHLHSSVEIILPNKKKKKRKKGKKENGETKSLKTLLRRAAYTLAGLWRAQMKLTQLPDCRHCLKKERKEATTCQLPTETSM